MTDEEITKLCAEAMGWKHLGAVGVVPAEGEYSREVEAKYPGKLWCLSRKNDWWEDPEGRSVCGPCSGIPDPLSNDADAMALVKRLKLSLTAEQVEGGIHVMWFAETDKTGACDINLNRAIAEAAAAIQSSAAESPK